MEVVDDVPPVEVPMAEDPLIATGPDEELLPASPPLPAVSVPPPPPLSPMEEQDMLLESVLEELEREPEPESDLLLDLLTGSEAAETAETADALEPQTLRHDELDDLWNALVGCDAAPVEETPSLVHTLPFPQPVPKDQLAPVIESDSEDEEDAAQWPCDRPETLIPVTPTTQTTPTTPASPPMLLTWQSPTPPDGTFVLDEDPPSDAFAPTIVAAPAPAPLPTLPTSQQPMPTRSGLRRKGGPPPEVLLERMSVA